MKHPADKMCGAIRAAMYDARDEGIPVEQVIDEAADAVENAADDLKNHPKVVA